MDAAGKSEAVTITLTTPSPTSWRTSGSTHVCRPLLTTPIAMPAPNASVMSSTRPVRGIDVGVEDRLVEDHRLGRADVVDQQLGQHVALGAHAALAQFGGDPLSFVARARAACR